MLSALVLAGDKASVVEMTLAELAAETAATLRGAVGNPHFEAEYIIAEILGISAPELRLARLEPAAAETAAAARRAAERRRGGEPLQYIFGRACFRGLDLKVGPGVLIPRPETETLAGLVIELAPRGGLVYDLGAGSGAIALAVAAERPDSRVVGIDISPAAVDIAKDNAATLGLGNVTFVLGDFNEVPADELADVVVSNPPYIPAAEYEHLPGEVKYHEPRLALHGGTDGLDAIRRVAATAALALKPGGLLALEFGDGHYPAVAAVVATAGFAAPAPRRHLNGKTHFATAWKPGLSERVAIRF